jgi:tetratricopeptide (TPR) repeat protein
MSSSIPPDNGQSVQSRLDEARALHSQGKLEQARAIYDAVLATEPDNADALHLCGLLHFQQREPGEAETLMRAAIAQRPDFMRAHSNLGAVLMAQGRAEEASVAFQSALDLKPDDDDALFNLGTACQALGRLDDAVAHYRTLLARSPDMNDARLNLGTALRDTGQIDAALEAFSEAVQRAPSLPLGHYNLGVALRDTGQLDGAREAFRQALVLAPDFADAAFNLANTLNDLGDRDAAASEFRKVIELRPDDPRAHFALGTVQRELQQLDAAIASLERTLALDPEHADAVYALGLIRLQQGDAARALEGFEHNLHAAPDSARELSLKAVALGMLGDEEGARRIMDLDRFLSTTQVREVDGYPSPEAFNAALAAHVQGHPTLMPSPPLFTTRHGLHTLELFEDDAPPIRALCGAIEQQVRRYLAEHPRDPDHPFLRDPPVHWRLTGWAVVMDTQGHQVPHVHPSAWLSGVYYVQIPGVVSAPGEGHVGWIEFGRPESQFPVERMPPLQWVRPEPGALVLFPGYFYHCTVPLEGPVGEDERRISIAFDVVREA